MEGDGYRTDVNFGEVCKVTDTGQTCILEKCAR